MKRKEKTRSRDVIPTTNNTHEIIIRPYKDSRINRLLAKAGQEKKIK